MSLILLLACSENAAPPPTNPPKVAEAAKAAPPKATNTCTGTWPSYWQDPKFDSQGMWKDQIVTNTAASQGWEKGKAGWTNDPFQISDDFSHATMEDAKAQPWRDSKYDEMFKPDAKNKSALAAEYGWAVLHYAQAGNIDSGDVNTDWTLCNNKVRSWYHMPFQTYAVLSGREFIHGLTREAPVTFSLKSRVDAKSNPNGTSPSTVWAVGFYNSNAATSLAKIWGADGKATVPTDNFSFAEGSVVGKLLLTTLTEADMPFLKGLPVWTANLSNNEKGDPGNNNPSYCNPPPRSPPLKPTMHYQSEICPRKPGQVTLMQFDIAVKDSRAPSGWVFGTFVADGENKANEANPWNRISLLGMTWGNDTPPAGQLAATYPVDPRKNGFGMTTIEWETVDHLNASGGPVIGQQPAHLGCNLRLNGPADNTNSSCLSCHMTGSVPDKNNVTPPMVSTFTAPPLKLTNQCATYLGVACSEQGGVTCPEIDSIYFADTKCAMPINMTVNNKNILGDGVPSYADGSTTWRSTDLSMQLSAALVSWQEWQGDLAKEQAPAPATPPDAKAARALKAAPPEEAERVFEAPLPGR